MKWNPYNAEKYTSIVCPIRNRNERLRDVLANWLSFQIPQIVIVDLRDDGCETAWDVVKEFNDSRIKVIETKYEYRWVLSIANNLGYVNCNHEYILKLDVDYVLSEDFFEKNIPSYSSYVCGIGNEYPDKWNLYGLMYVGRQLWGAVGGFNENMIYYGREDEDFADRLSKMGLHRQLFRQDTVKHIPHTIALSLVHQIGTLNKNNDKEKDHIRYVFVEINKIIAQNFAWSNVAKMARWDISELDFNRYLAIRNVS
jgi:predicted glycosyltransferase involved in capsule biosynthesis